MIKQENLDLKTRSEVLNNERNQIQSNLEVHHQELRKSKDHYSLLDTQVTNKIVKNHFLNKIFYTSI